MTAVNIETIKEIINKVGNPADIDDSAHTEANNAFTSETNNNDGQGKENFFSSFCDETSVFGKIKKNISSRRFYRNADNKMLGGICSGLADYFGVGDVTIWRLAILVLAFVGWGFNMSFFHHIFPFNIINFTFNFLVPLTYFVIWIVVPEARTAEDKLRMQGMDVNPENIREQVVSDSEVNKTERVTTENKASGCLKKTLLICFALLLMLPLFIAFIAVLIAIFIACLFVFGGVSVVAGIFPEIVDLAEPITAWGPALWVGLIAALLAVGIPINAFIRLFKSNTKPLSSFMITGIVIIWLLSIAVIVGSVTSGAMKFHEFQNEKRIKDGTRNGICLYDSHQWEVLDELGMKLAKFENIIPMISDGRTGYGGLPYKAIKLHRDNSGKAMSFTISRTEHFDEGDYVLESLIDVEGKGGVIKAVDEGKDVAFNDLSDEGQKLWTMDWTEGSKLPIFENPDSAGWDGFAKDGREHWTYRDGREHWTYRVSKPFHHKAGDITISVSADKAYLNKFNIRQVRLRNTKEKKQISKIKAEQEKPQLHKEDIGQRNKRLLEIRKRQRKG